jgi:hypothetical protein
MKSVKEKATPKATHKKKRKVGPSGWVKSFKVPCPVCGIKTNFIIEDMCQVCYDEIRHGGDERRY